MKPRGLRALARVRRWARLVVGGLALLVAGCGAAGPIHADAAAGEGAPAPAMPPTSGASASSASYLSGSNDEPRPPAGQSARGVVLLVRTPRHLEAALATADTMRAGDAGGPPRPFHVIACGDAIEAVLRDAAAEPRIRAAVASGVVVTACGMTLEEKGIDAARLGQAVTLVPNGLVEAIRLQEAGFVSIEL